MKDLNINERFIREGQSCNFNENSQAEFKKQPVNLSVIS